ncbi:hypothetical protein MBLNU230_g7727t1 [Neophaeotheca triangularis]
MQSLLQYRRFKTALKQQLDRDGDKAQASRKHRSDTTPSSNSQQPPNETEWNTSGDLEKGTPLAPKESHDSGRTPKGVKPGELDPSIQPPPLSEEEQIMEENQRNFEPAEEVDSHSDQDSDDGDRNVHPALSRTTTQQSAGVALGAVLTGIELRKRPTGSDTIFVVGYEGDNDPQNPHNWSTLVRTRATMLIACIGAVVGFASAIDSTALEPAAREFGVEPIVESLATGLYLISFGLGSLVAGPLSETFGRNPVYIVTLVLFMIFEIAAAVSPNVGAQLTFRFFAGLFGCTPLTCAGGSLSDLWTPLERVYAYPIFANAAFTGPLIGPVLGGFIVQSDVLSWRWVNWITVILAGLVTAAVVLFQPETHPPTLLFWKAQHLRTLTGDSRYVSELEIRQETLLHRLKRACYRPFLLTVREPIIILIALYLTIIYIVLFTFLDGYTHIFGETYGLSTGLTGLSFVGIIVGFCFAGGGLVPLMYKWAKNDLARMKEAGHEERLPPEFRCWFGMLGGSFAIPIGIFWMGYTARSDISIWSPLCSSVLIGYGMLSVFIMCTQYIIDSYELYAASGLASVTCLRYVAAGVMTPVGLPFYENMGVQWTLTILGGLSALLVPVPFVFYVYGPWIRSKSRYAVDA